MNHMTYNIPAAQLEAYRGKSLIVRSRVASELTELLSEDTAKHLVSVQLLSLSADGDALTRWGEGMPIELVMHDPQQEFSKLYRFSRLLETHPLRVAIPVTQGFSKAVKLAVSLNFAVILRLEQPDHQVVEELLQVLDFYLHQTTASQPIEFFHSLLLAFCHQQPATLWAIQEEDPALYRYITEQGEELISPRFTGISDGEQLNSFVERFSQELLDERGECDGCQFFPQCMGYFKWPNREFACDGVKILLHNLETAGTELREALHTFQEPAGAE